MNRRWIALVGLFACGLVVIACLPDLANEAVGRLLIGWWTYLERVTPQVAVAWDGVATAVVCLVLFVVGLQLFLRWMVCEIRRKIGPSDASPRPWRIRSTAALTLTILLMFIASIAAAGVMHQTLWLLTAKRPLTTTKFDARNLYLNQSANLRYIGMGIISIEHLESRAEGGRNLQSWQTKILPYTSFGTPGAIHEELPWNDPLNSANFKGVVPIYLNPEVIGAIRDPEGYALSHYAGNVHVWDRIKPLTMRDLNRGASNTIAAGDAASGFKPWGDPMNLRDPSRGIGTTADRFGSPSGTGATLLFLDGSVRFLRSTTNPKVLRGLSGAR